MDRNMKISILVIMGLFFLSTIWAAENTEVYKATIDNSGAQKVEILAGSYFFKPNNVIVKVNVPVEITIKKEPGVAPHDIVLHAPEAGIDFKVELSTEQKVIKFTPTKVGKYPFYCDHRFLFWSHRAKGMEGMLEVTD
jgi:plastocyanin domain-containing protein